MKRGVPMIEIIRENRLIHLRNACISYVMAELPGGVLAHLYFGAPLRTLHPQGLLRHAGIASIEDFTVQECSLDKLPQELPSFGLGDMRPGAVTVEGPDGSWSADLRLVSSEVIDGKPALQDLPATRDAGGSKTLRLTLRDEHTGLEAQLLYTLFEHLPVVARSVRLPQPPVCHNSIPTRSSFSSIASIFLSTSLSPTILLA